MASPYAKKIDDLADATTALVSAFGTLKVDVGEVKDEVRDLRRDVHQVRAIFGLNGKQDVDAPEVLNAQRVWGELATARAARIQTHERRAIAADVLFGWLTRRLRGAPYKTIAAVVGFVSTLGWAVLAVNNVIHLFK